MQVNRIRAVTGVAPKTGLSLKLKIVLVFLKLDET